MNILLVYPEYPESFYTYNESIDYISKKCISPPLGLLTVAAMLPDNWNTKLIDCNVTELIDDDIQWADMIFLSGMFIHQDDVLKLIKRFKNHEKKIVAGGPLFTMYYELYGKKNKIITNVDHLVLNEAEVTLPLFLKDLEEGKPRAVYTSKERPDIKKTPIPVWELVDIDKYVQMVVQYSRGCPNNCEFCNILFHFGRVPRVKSPEQMIKELQALYDIGWRGIVFIVDDNFIGNKKQAKNMLRRVIKWQKEYNYPFGFSTQIGINMADDDELMDLMVAANFINVFIGFETPNKESLKECNKIQNINRDLLKSVRKIQNKGIEPTGGFIVGFDSDTDSIFNSQIEFIEESAIVMLMINILNVPPMTPLWHRLKKEGRLLKESSGDSTDGTIQFKSKMGNKKLLEGYKKVISAIFNPATYYKRVERLIRFINPNTKSRITMNSVFAFFKSIWRIGFLSNYKFLYWRLLIQTLRIKPKAFSIAVKSIVRGEHYFRYAKKILSTIT